MNEALAPGRDGLPQELRLRKHHHCWTTLIGFCEQKYIARVQSALQVKASERGTAFVPLRRKELDLVFSLQHERVVARDNTVSFANRVWQLERSQTAGHAGRLPSHRARTSGPNGLDYLWSTSGWPLQADAVPLGDANQRLASQRLEKSGQKAA